MFISTRSSLERWSARGVGDIGAELKTHEPNCYQSCVVKTDRMRYVEVLIFLMTLFG